ncbi:MAG: hypothetical protein J6U57_10140, partial [Bacteroidales bacterium]|nr:hypothetical protein [Bacteroidales bacterium]
AKFTTSLSDLVRPRLASATNLSAAIAAPFPPTATSRCIGKLQSAPETAPETAPESALQTALESGLKILEQSDDIQVAQLSME